MTKKINIIICIITIITLISCNPTTKRSVKFDCKYSENKESMGSEVNTRNDEIIPTLFNNELFYTIKTKEKKPKEYLYKVNLNKIPFIGDEQTSFTFSGLMGVTTPSFYLDKDSNLVAMFAAYDKKDNRKDRNIYQSIKLKNVWQKPEQVKSINSKNSDNHISLTSDGLIAIIASDRTGGLGGFDLYMSKRSSDDTWSKPTNLGEELNSTTDDAFPTLTKEGNLYFSSRNLSARNDYNIFKSRFVKNKFEKPVLLPFPINSDKDENGAVVYGDNVIVSSNRLGGCGGFDLYKFDLCLPLVISGKVESVDEESQAMGNISLYEESNLTNPIQTININENIDYKFEVKSGINYIVRYTDDCDKELFAENRIETKCNEENINLVIQNFKMPKGAKFNFEQYDVPFFLSGYYLPIIKSNLDEIKLRFSYNLIGNDSTKYIEYPNDEYYAYSTQVESALKSATDFVIEKIKLMKTECNSKYKELEIEIYGYADDRKFGERSIYDGPTINDPILKISISEGVVMTNTLISTLRAYHTAKEIQKRVKMSVNEGELENVKFNIEGKGIDNNKKQDELKRRVDINIRPIKD